MEITMGIQVDLVREQSTPRWLKFNENFSYQINKLNTQRKSAYMLPKFKLSGLIMVFTIFLSTDNEAFSK